MIPIINNNALEGNTERLKLWMQSILAEMKDIHE